jgi:hypothetical protein
MATLAAGLLTSGLPTSGLPKSGLLASVLFAYGLLVAGPADARMNARTDAHANAQPQALRPASAAAGLPVASAADPLPRRTATARIRRIDMAVARLDGVVVQLAWPAGAEHGVLRLQAAHVQAPSLGYAFRNLDWQCPLLRDAQGGWQCDGPLRAAGGTPMRLAVDISTAVTRAELRQGGATLQLERNAAAPDDTRFDLRQVPLAWTQALLAQAWPAARLTAGTLDGSVAVAVPTRRPLQIDADLTLAGAGLEASDGRVAIGDLGGSVQVGLRMPGDSLLVAVSGNLRGGELLFGNAYVALPPTPVAFAVDARQSGKEGWQVPRLHWRDGDALGVEGSAALDADAGLQALSVSVRSDALASVGERYLSGWLGLAGLTGLDLGGALSADVDIAATGLQRLHARLQQVHLRDPQGRFAFDGIDGDLRFLAATVAGTRTPIDSALRWRGGALYGLDFGPAQWLLRSEQGVLRLREPVVIAMLDGEVRFDPMTLRPPHDGEGLQMEFGLHLDELDVGTLAKALDWPAFRGSLSGSIPSARYANDRLDFDGGLSMQVFDGRVDVSALSMERPFGVAPTLSSDVVLHDLDLLAITEVFDFGSISGRLDGRIDALRLVDWKATAFDARLQTERRRGNRQRISQRAVQNISSVGDASFVTSLQGQLIGLFDDFGYRQIGIGCRLLNEVCRMSGLHSAGQGFTIVQGAGIPRLNVVGFNRDVDWPTLLERLAAVAGGEVAPVID